MAGANARAARVRIGKLAFVKTGMVGFDVRDPYSFAIGLSWGQFALLFVGLELAINILFAGLYLMQPGAVTNLPPGSFMGAFFFSMETLATVGYGVMAPATFYGHVVAGVEIISGTAFTAIMTGLTFVRFSRPRARILYADQAVVARHNGQPTLMLRLANGWSGLMTDATARLTVLLAERSAEGQYFRRTHELRLERSRSPLFAITWTLMHVIGPDSPLHGMDADAMKERNLRLFLTVEAWDVKLNATVHDLRDYEPAEILFGMRFVDAIRFDASGAPIADMSRLSLVEPETSERVSVEGAD